MPIKDPLKRREYCRRRYAEQKERGLTWYQRNRRRVAEYYVQNKEYLDEQHRLWREANPIKFQEYSLRSLAKLRADPERLARRNANINERRDQERERRAVLRELLAPERAKRRAEAKERRLEDWRVRAKRWRADNPEKKREADRAYRAANPETVKAAQSIRRRRRWEVNREAVVAEINKRKELMQTAVRVLRERGIIPKQRWHYRVDYTAALQLARELGLIDGRK
jgi:hypothetical protein